MRLLAVTWTAIGHPQPGLQSYERFKRLANALTGSGIAAEIEPRHALAITAGTLALAGERALWPRMRRP